MPAGPIEQVCFVDNDGWVATLQLKYRLNVNLKYILSSVPCVNIGQRPLNSNLATPYINVSIYMTENMTQYRFLLQSISAHNELS